jgi:hypothetical protein
MMFQAQEDIPPGEARGLLLGGIIRQTADAAQRPGRPIGLARFQVSPAKLKIDVVRILFGKLAELVQGCRFSLRQLHHQVPIFPG